MKKTTCPGCGAPWKGRRCPSCGYESFRETSGKSPVFSEKSSSRQGGNRQKKHPLLGFLVLLALIGALIPLLRSWGLELEALEEGNRSTAWASAAPTEAPFAGD